MWVAGVASSIPRFSTLSGHKRLCPGHPTSSDKRDSSFRWVCRRRAQSSAFFISGGPCSAGASGRAAGAVAASCGSAVTADRG